MEKAKFKCVQYQESRTITAQGTYKSIKHYLKDGFFVKEDRNGYWVLIKPATVNVTIEGIKTGITETFNMKADIVNYFGKCRISYKLVESFLKECKDGKITFKISEDGRNYSFNG